MQKIRSQHCLSLLLETLPTLPLCAGHVSVCTEKIEHDIYLYEQKRLNMICVCMYRKG